MTPVPDRIRDFILSNHVLSLCTQDRDGLWAASCFYAYDPGNTALVVLSSVETRHGRAMAEFPKVAGTIAGQPIGIREIRGLQYGAEAELLSGERRAAALNIYTTLHPLAKLAHAEVWGLRLEHLKHTDNRYIFGQKTYWTKDSD